LLGTAAAQPPGFEEASSGGNHQYSNSVNHSTAKASYASNRISATARDFADGAKEISSQDQYFLVDTATFLGFTTVDGFTPYRLSVMTALASELGFELSAIQVKACGRSNKSRQHKTQNSHVQLLPILPQIKSIVLVDATGKPAVGVYNYIRLGIDVEFTVTNPDHSTAEASYAMLREGSLASDANHIFRSSFLTDGE
jgi:hypothetical protein